MEGKHEEFWRQGDFGYVKKEVDSMMNLCKPQNKVGTDDNYIHSYNISVRGGEEVGV